MVRLILFSLIIILQFGCGRILFFLEGRIHVGTYTIDNVNLYIPMDTAIYYLKRNPYIKVNHVLFENDSVRVNHCLEGKREGWLDSTQSCDTSELFKEKMTRKYLSISCINDSRIEEYMLGIYGDTAGLHSLFGPYVHSRLVLGSVKFKGDKEYTGYKDSAMTYKRYKYAQKMFHKVIIGGRILEGY